MHRKRTFIGAVSSGASRALFFGGDGDLDGGSQLLDWPDLHWSTTGDIPPLCVPISKIDELFFWRMQYQSCVKQPPKGMVVRQNLISINQNNVVVIWYVCYSTIDLCGVSHSNPLTRPPLQNQQKLGLWSKMLIHPSQLLVLTTKRWYWGIYWYIHNYITCMPACPCVGHSVKGSPTRIKPYKTNQKTSTLFSTNYSNECWPFWTPK